MNKKTHNKTPVIPDGVAAPIQGGFYLLFQKRNDIIYKIIYKKKSKKMSFVLTPYYSNCIICGKKSNGKPQCLNCWTYSTTYAHNCFDNSFLAFTVDRYKLIYNNYLTKARTCKNKKRKLNYCNQIIGISLYADDKTNNTNHFSAKAYEDVINLLNDKPKLTPLDEPKELDFISNNIDPETNTFREKFPANYRCIDGHSVRSQTEREIANYFYYNKLQYSYEPKFRLTEEEKRICKKYGKDYNCFYPDFYIPQYNLYIEYFGLNDEKYNQKMDLKIKIFGDRKDINFRYLTHKNNETLIDDLADILNQFK